MDKRCENVRIRGESGTRARKKRPPDRIQQAVVGLVLERRVRHCAARTVPGLGPECSRPEKSPWRGSPRCPQCFTGGRPGFPHTGFRISPGNAVYRREECCRCCETSGRPHIYTADLPPVPAANGTLSESSRRSVAGCRHRAVQGL